MATQSPFSFVGEAIEQFVTHAQPPVWVMDESINRLVLFLNHVIGAEPEALKGAVHSTAMARQSHSALAHACGSAGACKPAKI
jgi:hypothetical protein